MDIALLFSDMGDFDIRVENGDLLGDSTPVTPTTVSLFTDARAEADDFIPDGTDDLRGWWGDAAADYRMGSRLWLLSREKELQETVDRANLYANEALEWIAREGGRASAWAYTGAREYAGAGVYAGTGARGRLFVEADVTLIDELDKSAAWKSELDATKGIVVNFWGVK